MNDLSELVEITEDALRELDNNISLEEENIECVDGDINGV